MLDELSALIEAVANVPELAVWVAVGFLVYKLLLAASIVAACLAGWRALMHAVTPLCPRYGLELGDFGAAWSRCPQ
jgi:hypothetical protein